MLDSRFLNAVAQTVTFYLQHLKQNHCHDRAELDEIRTKHKELKRKSKSLQKRYVRMEEHYKSEIERLQEAHMTQLKEYKLRMEGAYEARERGVRLFNISHLSTCPNKRLFLRWKPSCST